MPSLASEKVGEANCEAIREAVRDLAIEHFTGKEPPDDPTQKEQVIEALLKGTEEEVKHPVVRDELPDIDLTGSHQVLRQWSIRIGKNSCEIGLFAGDTEGEATLEVIS